MCLFAVDHMGQDSMWMASSAQTTAEACVQQFTASNCNLATAYTAATDDMMMVAGA